MPKGAAIILVAGVLAVVMMAMLVQAMFIVDRLVTVDQVAGTARYSRGEGSPRPLREGMLLQVGDIVRTGSGATVGVRWVDGTRLKIGPDTVLVLKRSRADKLRKTEDTRVRVNWGQVWFRVRRAIKGDSKFEVETPAVVAAVRGTVFSVIVNRSGQTAVSVYEGEVALQAGGDQAVVTAHREAVVGRAGIATDGMTAQELAAWTSLEGVVGPLLQVTSPTAGPAGGGQPAVTADPYLPLEGKTEPGIRVMVVQTVAGDTAPSPNKIEHQLRVDAKGQFGGRIPLLEGENTLAVLASDPDGRTTAVHRTITYVSPATHLRASCERDDLPADAQSVAAVSVTVQDAQGRAVPDGTPVRLAANAGSIDRIARTADGVAQATFTAPGQPATVTITASSGAGSAVLRLTAHNGGQPAPQETTSPAPETLPETPNEQRLTDPPQPQTSAQ